MSPPNPGMVQAAYLPPFLPQAGAVQSDPNLSSVRYHHQQPLQCHTQSAEIQTPGGATFISDGLSCVNYTSSPLMIFPNGAGAVAPLAHENKGIVYKNPPAFATLMEILVRSLMNSRHYQVLRYKYIISLYKCVIICILVILSPLEKVFRG